MTRRCNENQPAGNCIVHGTVADYSRELFAEIDVLDSDK
jgi:hypothetical protein